MPGGKGDWQLASVPAGQHSGMWQKVKVSGNGRMRRRNGTGVEVMGGIGKKDGTHSHNGGTGKKRKRRTSHL